MKETGDIMHALIFQAQHSHLCDIYIHFYWAMTWAMPGGVVLLCCALQGAQLCLGSWKNCFALFSFRFHFSHIRVSRHLFGLTTLYYYWYEVGRRRVREGGKKEEKRKRKENEVTEWKEKNEKNMDYLTIPMQTFFFITKARGRKTEILRTNSSCFNTHGVD